jgi:hypothetical protein
MRFGNRTRSTRSVAAPDFSRLDNEILEAAHAVLLEWEFGMIKPGEVHGTKLTESRSMERLKIALAAHKLVS